MNTWFFGDSTTFCHGLRPGFSYYDNFPENRSKLWTEIISEYFKTSEVNYSFCGASNEDIRFRLATNLFRIQKNDYVVIQSTYSARMNIFDKNKLFRPVHFAFDNETINTRDFSKEQVESLTNFVKYNLIDHVDKFELRDLIFFLSIKKSLEKRGVKTLFWHHSVMDKSFRDLNKWTDIQKESKGVVDDNYHLGFSSQESFANFLISTFESGISSIIPSCPICDNTRTPDLNLNSQKLDKLVDNLYRDISDISITKKFDESYLYYTLGDI
jgi:hypothetical protein